MEQKSNDAASNDAPITQNEEEYVGDTEQNARGTGQSKTMQEIMIRVALFLLCFICFKRCSR